MLWIWTSLKIFCMIKELRFSKNVKEKPNNLSCMYIIRCKYFTTQSWVLITLKGKAFECENILRTEENAGNQHFSFSHNFLLVTGVEISTR